MKYLKLFENIRSKKETVELLEDLFVEIFDKWEIKELANDIDPELGDIGYSIIPFFTTSSLDRVNKILLMIKQNAFEVESISKFNNMVADCQPVLKRLKLYDINYEWGSYDFGRLQYFRVIVYP